MENKNIFKTIRENNKPNLGKILLPWQVTGLTDGEGGFYCSILKTGAAFFLSLF